MLPKLIVLLLQIGNSDTPKVLRTLDYYQKGHKKNRPLCAPIGLFNHFKVLKVFG